MVGLAQDVLLLGREFEVAEDLVRGVVEPAE